MTRIAPRLILLVPVLLVPLLGGCANPGAPVAAPSGIRAQNGGGERQLGLVNGGNVGAGGVLATTVVR